MSDESNKGSGYANFDRALEKPAEQPATHQAATVILLRDGAEGLETLMLRRNSKLDFVGGMWVFPGGRLDPVDWEGIEPDDRVGASRRAAVREAREESGLEIEDSALDVYSHWEPPSITPKRFLTWFFVAPAPSGTVEIDGGEIHESAWMRPAEALRRRDASEIELAPPTWVTLYELSQHADVAAAIASVRAREPESFTTKIARVDGGVAALWHGDAGYDSSDPSTVGPRHRLGMLKTSWRYERTP